jgi:DtxR family Mn-dependent transcriptional regulator
MKLTISKENYLKAIAEAEAEGESVIGASLARWLELSPPAVTAAVRRLKRDGLIRIDRQGQIALTSSGRRIADRVLLRHYLIERMLAEMFGMEWYKVHEEAERLEHAVSDDFERKLAKVLGTGKPCPHGSMVGKDAPDDRRRRGWMTLDEIRSPGRVVLVSVFERDRRFMEFLEQSRLRPGVVIDWLEQNYDETLTLRVDRKTIRLGCSAAKRIWVRPVA